MWQHGINAPRARTPVAPLRRRWRAIALSASLVAGFVSETQGQSRTWVLNGSGTWGTSANWSGGNVPNSNTETAVFSLNNPGGGIVVTVAAPVGPQGIQFNSTSTNTVTFNASGGSVLTLTPNAAGLDTILVDANSGNHVFNLEVRLGGNDSQNFNIGSGRTLTFNGVVSSDVATRSLTKTGAGTLVFNGNNTYGGATTISAGTLEVDGLANGGSASGIGASSNAAANLVLNGGTLRYTGPTVSINRNYTLGSSGGRFDASGSGPLTISGSMTASAITGSQTLTLAGSNTGANTLSGVIANGGGSNITNLTKSGSGLWTLSASNSYTGRTLITGGTLSINSVANDGVNSAIGAASDVAARVGQANAPLPHLILDGGTLRYTGSGHSTNRHFALGPSGGTIEASGSGALNISNWWAAVSYGADGARTLTLSGTNSNDNTLGLVLFDYDFGFPGGDPNGSPRYGAATSLRKTGSGKWVIPNTVPNQPPGDTFQNYYTGSTTISGGILEVGRLANGLQPSAIGASSGVASNLVLDGGTLRYVYPGAPGTAAHDAGQVDRNFTIGVGGGTIDVSGNGPLNLYNGDVVGLSGSGARTLTLTGTFANPADGTNQYNAINGVIGDSGGATSIVKDGTGEWVFTNANTYSGSTTINAGTLLVAHGNNRIPGGTVMTIGAAGRFEIFTGDTVFAYEPIGQEFASLSGSGTAALNAGTLQVGNASSTTYSGRIIDSNTGGPNQTGGSFVKVGSATLTLSGLNSYTGVTAIRGGTLSVNTVANGGSASAIGASGVSAGNLIIDGGALRYTGATASTNRGFTLGAAGGTIDASGTGSLSFTGGMVSSATSGAQVLTLTGSNTGANTIAPGIVNGTGSSSTSLVKSGAGQWRLAGASLYSGTTSVNSGTLVLTGSHAGGGNYSVASGATLAGTATITPAANNTITLSGRVSPGVDAPGVFTLSTSGGSGATALAAAGEYRWELNNEAGSAGTNWDRLDLQTVNVTAINSPGSRFVIRIVSLTAGNVPGAMTQGVGQAWNPNNHKRWTIATAVTGLSTALLNRFEINTSGFANTIAGGFSLDVNNGDLEVVYVPEPTSGTLTIAGMLLPFLRRRRRVATRPRTA